MMLSQLIADLQVFIPTEMVTWGTNEIEISLDPKLS